MSQEIHPGARQLLRKPIPSHYEPLAPDETLPLSFDDPQTDELRGENTQRARWRAEENGNEHTGVETRAMVRGVADDSFDSNEAPQYARSRRRNLLAWWPEVVWCVVSVVCIAMLVSILSVYNDKPLPSWPLGLTLNTVIAFISTVCRTAFVIPVVEGLSQSKWNWFKRHGSRPLEDFQVFDEASRGPWGSLKLLFTLKGRLVALLSAFILVTGIATSTVTQSVVAYRTRQVLAEGASEPLTKRNDRYTWAASSRQFIGFTMYPVYQAVLKGLATPPEEEVPYYQASCSTGICTWPLFTSLAVCVDAKNVTDQLTIEHDRGGLVYKLKSTLPNGMVFHSSIGMDFMNISDGPTLSYSGTDLEKAELFRFFVYYSPEPRAIEVMMHWCVNTYAVTVEDSVPVTRMVASYTRPEEGEIMMDFPNQTAIGMYLTTPDDPGHRYPAGGMGSSHTASVLRANLVGTTSQMGELTLGNGTEIFSTEVYRSTMGIPWENNPDQDQMRDDARLLAVKRLTQNLASEITNALLDLNHTGLAWRDETYVHVRWPWLTLLVAQVGLSVLTFILVVAQTAGLDIEIVKGSSLPALLAVKADEKASLMEEQHHMSGTSSKIAEPLDLQATGITGAFHRSGRGWTLEK